MKYRTPISVQKSVVFALVIRELKTRFGGRWIGAFWTLVEPLSHVLIYVFLFGTWRAAKLPNIDYPVFLATGLLPFFLLRTLALRLTDAINSNRGLFSYRPVKPFDTFIARAFLEVVLSVVVLLITFGLLAFWGNHNVLPHRPLEWMGSFALIITFGFGLGVTFSVACHALPRLRVALSLVFFPLYFLSAIMMPIQALPSVVHPYLLWNPLLHLFEVSRSFFFTQYSLVEGITLAYPAALALVFFALGLSLYRVRRLALLREA